MILCCTAAAYCRGNYTHTRLHATAVRVVPLPLNLAHTIFLLEVSVVTSISFLWMHAQFETSGEGEELQRSLLEYAADKDSYIEEFWDDSYLTANSSVVLNLK